MSLPSLSSGSLGSSTSSSSSSSGSLISHTVKMNPVLSRISLVSESKELKEEKGCKERQARLEEELMNYERALDVAMYQAAEYKKKQASFGQTQEFRQKLLEFQSNVAQLYFKRGRTLYEVGQKQKARISLMSASRLRPENEVRILSDLAYLLNELGQCEEALKCYDEFLKNQPKHAQAWGRRGRLLHALKRHEEALESYNQSLSLRLDESIFHKRDEVIEILSQKVPILIKKIQNNSITSLNLSNFTILNILPTPHMGGLTSKDLEPVLDVLKENTSVTCLDLSNNLKLTDEAIPLIVSLFSVGFFSSFFLRQKPNITLKEIDLQETSVTYEGMRSLIEEIKNTGLAVRILHNWQYAISDGDLSFSRGKELGSGGYAKVYKGVYKQKEPVAIKTFIEKQGEQKGSSVQANFLKEVRIVARLLSNSSDDSHVVKFYGYCPYLIYLPAPCYVLVMEVMKCSLAAALYSKTDCSLDFSLDLYYQIAIDVLRGLATIHSLNIIHLDLKSSNILLDNKGRAKITDFGLSEKVHESKQSTPISKDLAKFKGNIGWRAPELMGEYPVYSEKSDIYSFGMVLWEMATRKNPYKEMKKENVEERVRRGERETIPTAFDPDFVHLMRWCWAQKPRERPTAKKAIEYLVGIAKGKKLELS